MLKISDYKNSLVSLFIRYLVVYSLVIVLTLTVIDYYISQVYLRSFPGIEDLFKYQERLDNDDFYSIPLFKLRGANFTVYDKDYNELFRSDYSAKNIPIEDIEFIPSYSYDNYYEVLEDEGSIIILARYLEDSRRISDYVLLDSDLKRVSGNLFSSQDEFSEAEIKLLSGLIDEDRNIMRYDYLNNHGEERIVIYNSPLFNVTYLNTLDLAYDLRYIIILVIVILMMLIESYLFRRKIIHLITPLNKAINSYKEGNLEVDYNNTLLEAKNIMTSFSDLANKLNLSNQEKEKYYQDKERIVADISHDLKTPLTVIQGYAKALHDGIVPEEKVDYYLSAIYERSVIANEVLNSFFEFTKLGHADYVLRKENLDLVEYTKQYLIGIYNSIMSSNFDLVIELEESIEVSIDRSLMKRVYQNLVNNAIKYSKGDTILFRITEDETYAYIDIADNGIGINDKVKKQIFEPFVTTNDARVSGEGTGLGLSIVKKIIDLHGGTINLISDPDYKTCFRITLKKS